MASTTDSQVAGATVTRSRTASPLTDDMLERFSLRSATYDRENAFFTEDFNELKQAGYLRLAIPTELGGFGFRLSDAVA